MSNNFFSFLFVFLREFSSILPDMPSLMQHLRLQCKNSFETTKLFLDSALFFFFKKTDETSSNGVSDFFLHLCSLFFLMLNNNNSKFKNESTFETVMKE